jgi:hypothetical protein
MDSGLPGQFGSLSEIGADVGPMSAGRYSNEADLNAERGGSQRRTRRISTQNDADVTTGTRQLPTAGQTKKPLDGYSPGRRVDKYPSEWFRTTRGVRNGPGIESHRGEILAAALRRSTKVELAAGSPEPDQLFVARESAEDPHVAGDELLQLQLVPVL